jgi:hypothetical protein
MVSPVSSLNPITTYITLEGSEGAEAAEGAGGVAGPMPGRSETANCLGRLNRPLGGRP